MSGTVEIRGRDASGRDSSAINVTAGAVHTIPIEMLSGHLFVDEKQSVSTARQTILIPSGLSAIEVTFFPTAAGSVYDLLDVVLNATTDTEADAKLSTPGTRYVVPSGKTLRQVVPPDGDVVTRIDLKTRAAAGGANLVITYGRMPE